LEDRLPRQRQKVLIEILDTFLATPNAPEKFSSLAAGFWRAVVGRRVGFFKPPPEGVP